MHAKYVHVHYTTFRATPCPCYVHMSCLSNVLMSRDVCVVLNVVQRKLLKTDNDINVYVPLARDQTVNMHNRGS